MRNWQSMSDIHQWVTTANGFDGFHTVRGLGLVRGITCRGLTMGGGFAAGIQQMLGGNIAAYTELAEHARVEAYEIMIQHAVAIGANAIIGVRYDATEITQGVAEVLCYGTAVVIAANNAPPQQGHP